MAWQSVISGAAKALQGAQQAKALIGPKSKKKKGGALTVRPKFNKTVQAIEEKRQKLDHLNLFYPHYNFLLHQLLKKKDPNLLVKNLKLFWDLLEREDL